MDNHDIRTLKILEEIDTDQVPSQRDMARKLNVSLGLVNSFIKRLTHKGYFKITTIPKNRVRYILTPKGASEKVRLTYEYIQYSVQYYKVTRKKLRELFDGLMSQGVQRIIFYGVSDLTEIAYISMQETTLKLEAVVDGNKTGKSFWGDITITDPSDLKSLSFDRLLITAIDFSEELMTEILSKGVSVNKIIKLK